MISPYKSHFSLCLPSPFSCPIYKWWHSCRPCHIRSCASVDIVLSSGAAILGDWASQRLQIVPAVFVYNIKLQILQCFGRQHGMCAGCVCSSASVFACVVIHGGQAEKEGRGHCLSRGGGVELLRLCCEEIWPEGLLPTPIGSHVTEESHLHINLLLYCSFSSPSALHTCSICSGLRVR